MILAFSGSLGAGKSSVSQAVAEQLGWPRASFGTFVRSVARARGLDTERETLQVLGAELLEEMGADGMLLATLRQSEWQTGENVVLDGVRHRDVLAAIRHLDTANLVFLDAEAETRSRRLQADDRPEDNLLNVEQHSTEVEVQQFLRAAADHKIDSSQPFESVVAAVLEALRRSD